MPAAPPSTDCLRTISVPGIRSNRYGCADAAFIQGNALIVHEWIDTAGALAAWMEQRGAATAPIGLDTEFMRTDTFRPKLALVQVNIGGAVALLDAPLLGAHLPLAARL